MKFNGVDFNAKIEKFPSYCNDKSILEIRNWIANKVIAGKYSEHRILKLKLKNGDTITFDVDGLKIINEQKLLTQQTINDIGIIRINNSLGNNQLIDEFDKALNSLSTTRGLIIDLRNTNNGGNTYVAKGIMSRFIDKELPYQKHLYVETYDNQPKITRSWLELVSPRGKQYTKPVIILVGRWTGSMGEGLAVGFDGMKRAKIVGTEMKRLAGSDYNYKFKNQNFGYKLVYQKLYHINGTPREKFVPFHYVSQTTINKDETLIKAFKLLNKISK
ncbi:S41 family peptidase [Lacinutrix salivirga]